jgi:glutathione synthase/RimK-type ligase-like ATP-grasp enzyme
MGLSLGECCILNAGDGSWAFEPMAARLSEALGIDVSETPRRFNYILSTDDAAPLEGCNSFIPLDAIRVASDKRLLAVVFAQHKVPTPETKLIGHFDGVRDFLKSNSNRAWCVKFPTSCGANGHRMLNLSGNEPPNWPRPFVVQEFIELKEPEVYRTYCAGGEMFGWVVRKFPSGSKTLPWVAHAQGARYETLSGAPENALIAAKSALVATNLWNSFGCVDLLRAPGEWLVLEVGTDGLFNHVDREVGDADLERQIEQKISGAFWRAAKRIDTA